MKFWTALKIIGMLCLGITVGLAVLASFDAPTATGQPSAPQVAKPIGNKNFNF